MDVSIESFHTLKFAIPARSTAPVIATSIIGLDNISHRVQQVLAIQFPDLHPKTVQVYVESVQPGSLLETILIVLWFGSQDEMIAFLRKIRERTGMDKVNPIIAVAITALILKGGDFAISKMSGKNETGASGTTISINGANNTINQYGANALHISPVDFERSISEGAGIKSSLASNAVKTLAPAKIFETYDSSVMIDENTALTISNSTIRETPSHIDRSPGSMQMELITNTSVLVRAIDLDNRKKGWSVVLPGLSENRMKLEFDQGINPKLLMRSDPFGADVEVYYTQDLSGNRKYRNAFIRSVSVP